MTCRVCEKDYPLEFFHKNHNKYRKDCKLCRNIYNQNWRKRNLEKSQAYHKEHKKKWRLKNKEKIKLYWDNKLKNDIQYKLLHYLRGRLRVALKNNYKTGSAVKDLGCSILEFKQYLETKFQSGMTWENQGQWHIDHIKPLSSFNLNERDQLLQACHYTNLQPLWAIDNVRKSNRF